MFALRVVRTMTACCVWIAASAFGQMQARLHTQQTSILLEAAPHAPNIRSLEGERSNLWKSNQVSALIPFVWVNGKELQTAWTFDPAASHKDAESVSFVYESQSPHLRIQWEWRVRDAMGPIEHDVHIRNLSDEDIWIPLQDSLQLKLQVPESTELRQMYIDKGAGRPSEIGTHEEQVRSGFEWKGYSSTYATDQGPREIIPWVMLEQPSHGTGLYLGLEFSGRTQIHVQRDSTTVQVTAGLNPDPGPFRTRLQPNETFDAPRVFLGAFSGGADGIGNTLRPWVRRVLGNAEAWKDPSYPLLVNNSWGSGMEVDEALAKRMIRDSAELGVDMFHIDAGWFRGVGDWYPDPKKFPNGLAAISDDAHAHGLRFGIWVNWAQAGVDTSPGALNARDPKVKNWLISDVADDWHPEPFVGRTMDIGEPAVHDYTKHEVERIVDSYRLDMLEHDGYLVAKECLRTDHPHAPPENKSSIPVTGSGILLPLQENATDVSYHAVRAYYDIYSSLRQKHQKLLLEVCDDGGRMVDFGTAAHGDYFSITDAYDPLSNRRAFYDASYILPAAMLEDYVEKWPTPTIANFRYMLRSGMMGWLTIMQDTNAWTPEQHTAAKEELATYKESLRSFIRDADLYHISPRPDGVHWDGIEYFDPKSVKGVVYAFHGSSRDEAQHVFQLHGLRRDRKYRLVFHDHSSADTTISGEELINTGLKVNLPASNSSELIFLTESGNS